MTSSKPRGRVRAILLSLLVLTALAGAGPSALATDRGTDDGVRIDPNG